MTPSPLPLPPLPPRPEAPHSPPLSSRPEAKPQRTDPLLPTPATGQRKHPRARHLRAIAALLLLPAPLLSQTPLPADDPAVADAVAHAFETARIQAHLRKLSRIADRPALRQITCTAAASGLLQDSVLARESQADSATFPLNGVDHLPPALGRIAEFDDRSSSRGRRIARYSVAAFTSPSNSSLTWVGIALYWSRAAEYVALHLTHTYYPPDLRFSLVEVCRSVH